MMSIKVIFVFTEKEWEVKEDVSPCLPEDYEEYEGLEDNLCREQQDIPAEVTEKNDDDDDIKDGGTKLEVDSVAIANHLQTCG